MTLINLPLWSGFKLLFFWLFTALWVFLPTTKRVCQFESRSDSRTIFLSSDVSVFIKLGRSTVLSDRVLWAVIENDFFIHLGHLALAMSLQVGAKRVSPTQHSRFDDRTFMWLHPHRFGCLLVTLMIRIVQRWTLFPLSQILFWVFLFPLLSMRPEYIQKGESAPTCESDLPETLCFRWSRGSWSSGFVCFFFLKFFISQILTCFGGSVAIALEEPRAKSLSEIVNESAFDSPIASYNWIHFNFTIFIISSLNDSIVRW